MYLSESERSAVRNLRQIAEARGDLRTGAICVYALEPGELEDAEDGTEWALVRAMMTQEGAVSRVLPIARAVPRDYGSYWAMVFGARSAEQLVSEFDLVTVGLQEWVWSCQAAAIAAAGLSHEDDLILAAFAAYEERAYVEISEAIEAAAADQVAW